MPRFNPIVAMIAAVAFAAPPALADEAAQTPPAPPASSAPSGTSPQPSTPPSSQPASQSAPQPASPPTLPGVVATTNNPNLAVAGIKLESGVRASKIIGEPVQNEQNQRVGTVDDLILSPESKVTMAIVSIGGFLGMGNKLVAVPWDQFKEAGGHLVLPGVTKDSLNAAPTFQY